MKEDYLWDKSGEPDPQIKELEEVLGTLRYQPRPLEIPSDLIVPRRRWNYFPVLAIAATVLLALIAAGIWLRSRTANEPQPQQAKIAPTPIPTEKVPGPQPKSDEKPTSRENTVAVNNKRRNRSSSPALSKREREEALAAKEQLMLALRLTSEKLNLVHRRTQNTTPANQIKNQHRAG